MISEKCSACGANIEKHKNGDKFVCPYCGTAYTIESAKAQKESAPQTTNTEKQNTVITAEKRPKINFFICIFLFYCGFLPGILYIGYKLNKQREWDEKYLGKNN